MWKAILIATLSTPLLISNACAGNRTDTAIGGAMGGAVCAAIGHELHGRDGAILGAAIGGATGAALGADYRREPQPRVVVREQERIVYAPPRPYERDYPAYRKHHKHGHGHHHGWHKHHHRRHHQHHDD